MTPQMAVGTPLLQACSYGTGLVLTLSCLVRAGTPASDCLVPGERTPALHARVYQRHGAAQADYATGDGGGACRYVGLSPRSCGYLVHPHHSGSDGGTVIVRELTKGCCDGESGRLSVVVVHLLPQTIASSLTPIRSGTFAPVCA